MLAFADLKGLRVPNRFMIVASLLLGFVLGSGAGHHVGADPLPALPLEDRALWIAIGPVNMAGFRNKSSCTGTLIAPDLVLTAAHCVIDSKGLKRKRHFVAGWDRGAFAAHGVVAQTFVHPDYFDATGGARIEHDIAVLRLKDPIAPERIAPLIPQTGAHLQPGPLTVLGYHRKRPNIINGRFDCRPLADTTPLILFIDCEVIAGNSGGPVLTATDTGWRIIAVIAARMDGPTPRSMAVPIGDWVLQHLQDATARAVAGEVSQ